MLCHFVRQRPLTRQASTSSNQVYIDAVTRLDKGTGGVNAFVSPVNLPPNPDSPGGESELFGRPIAVKDNICTASFPTTCSSAFLKEFNPSYDATVVSLLERAGGHIMGKTNCDEFGMGSFNTHSFHGPVANPFQPEVTDLASPWEDRELRSAGGSSGGSAAAVAASMCYAALGTDTGGSVRLPASYCGVAGFKPSYGLVSRRGVVSYADSLDCVGVLAKNSSRIRSVMEVISQYDPKDPTSIPESIRQSARHDSDRRTREWNPTSSQDDRFRGIRIGIPQEYFPTEMDPSLRTKFQRTLRTLKTLGAHLVPVSLPSTRYALSAYYVLASAEASSNLARYDGVRFGTYVKPHEGTDLSQTVDVYAQSRSKGFGPEVRKRILLGTYALTADAFDNYYLQAQRIRQHIKSDFNSVFKHGNPLATSPTPAPNGVDILLHPTAISSAPLLHQPLKASKATDGVDGYVQDILTVPASLGGLPSLSVPAGLASDGWPIGVSIVGQWGYDDLVLRFGGLYESVVQSEGL